MKGTHFENIWRKANKMKHKLMAKVKQRGLEPTYDNCKAYYLGIIRPYRDGRGEVYYLHKRNDKKQIWRISNDGRKQSIPRQDTPKKRRFRR